MNFMKNLLGNKKWMFSLSKYIFTLVLILVGYFTHKNNFIIFASVLELLTIMAISDIFVKFNKYLGYCINVLSLLLLNVQSLMLYFGGSFVTLVMVTNLESLSSQSGRFIPIAIGIVSLVIFTFMPLFAFPLKNIKGSQLLSVTLLLELTFTFLYGNGYSPLFAVYRLGLDARAYQAQITAIASQPNMTKTFYREKISDARTKADALSKKPNVVVLFIEGLSKNIVDDPRQVMPNMQTFQAQSISFTNYYNHTFATYRGLIGQLYSGYQLENYDTNTLTSMQSILADQGYQTTYINTEPNNTQFTSYVESFGFQQLVNDASKTDGPQNTITDEDALDLLYDTMEEQSASDEPYFISMYTFGTHQSYDSPDKKFGAGNYILLNRFYNFDYYFGKFIEKFNNSKMAEDTVLVVTTDHATFSDNDFAAAYPDYTRVNSDVDSIPLYLYYKGMPPEQLDVQGRNSLDMAPTVLDFIEVTAPNYFLGVSLFFGKENNNSYDTVFYDNTYLLSTDYGTIQPLSSTNEETVEGLLQKYFAAKTQTPLVPEE